MKIAPNYHYHCKTIFAIVFSFLSSISIAQENFIGFSPEKDNFCISASNKKTTILLSENEFAAVKNIAGIFAKDVQMVTGVIPEIKTDKASNDEQLIIIGTLGNSKIIDALVKKGKLDVSAIKNKWESSMIEVIKHPKAGIKEALVIVGSDKRGTIYGMLEVSKQMGVSPWYWWADVPVVKHPEVYIKPGRFIQNEPKVKYRGFFINDEAPALSGWAREKFGGFNHSFYEKVFELLLRMKGNYLWPAMWGSAFNADDSLNQKTADNFGVVTGTSHHEPMVRAHDEWRRFGSGPWNYEKNEQKLKEFWKQGIKRMGTSDNIVSLGMRGDGDVPMSQESNIALLERIVKDQREIISNVTGKAPGETPQMWALYKEVQDYYDKGMRVPDDVTLLLCDDNWGNIRKLPNLNEKSRKGGYGIYYHYDYVGGPRNYKWVNTNPIARVWEQMHLAYEYGVKQVWIVNVGDIKPMEFPLQFFMDYAWDPDKIPAAKLNDYTLQWSEQQFGKIYATDIAQITTKYLMYNSRRKPELLSPETYSLHNYLEAETVVKDYNTLLDQAREINQKLPKEYRDAFYQLVLHPVEACANLNELYVTVAKNRWYGSQLRVSTNEYAARAKKLYENDSLISEYYNKTMAGGKWNHMMDQTHIGYTYWQQPPKNTMPKVSEISIPENADMGVAVENSKWWWPADTSRIFLPEFNGQEEESHYFEIFNRGKLPFSYTVSCSSPAISFSTAKGEISKEERVWVSIDRKNIPSERMVFPIEIRASTGQKVTIYIKTIKPDIKDAGVFVASDGHLSIEAEHFSSKIETKEVKWLVIPNLGRTLSGVTPLPVTANAQIPLNKSPRLEYSFVTTDTGQFSIHVFLSPTLNFHNKSLRYAISVDEELPQIIPIHDDTSLKTWEKWVSDNVIISVSNHHIQTPGKHVIKYWMVDPGIVLQKIVSNLGGLKPSYLSPPESSKL